MILALICITIVYLFIIARFVFGFDQVENYKLKDLKPQTTFSIVIPFRNEADNLPKLLYSLSQLKYPKHLFETILIDDDSSDTSYEVIMKFNRQKKFDHIQGPFGLTKNERNSNSPKKDAILKGIQNTSKDWILTTDADCKFDDQWLLVLDAFIQEKHPEMVVGPVTYNAENSFFERFQSLDFMSLIGATIGGFGIQKPFLCNGANLAYKRTAFKNVDGFKGNDDIASGDDIFLMEKMLKKYPKKVVYLKHQSAVVSTKPQPSLSQLISQRRRWAAKTSSYSNVFGKLVGSVVLLMNFSLLAAAFLALFGVFSFKMIGYVFLIKFSIDLWLIFKTAQFMGKTKHLSSYAFSSVLYPFFNVYIAISSWYSGFTWKGRSFKK